MFIRMNFFKKIKKYGKIANKPVFIVHKVHNI